MNWTEKEYEEYLAKRKQTKPVPMSEAHAPENGVICSGYTIPLNPVTKKNHNQIVMFGKSCPVCGKKETGYEKSIGKSDRIQVESLEGSKGISSRRSLKRTRTNL